MGEREPEAQEEFRAAMDRALSLYWKATDERDEARRECERLKREIRDTLPTAHPNDHNWVVLVRHLVRSDTQGTQGGKHGD